MAREGLSTPPGHISPGIHILEHLFVLEGIHTGPKLVISISGQLLFFDQFLERLLDQFAA